jgi:hypothetical protein
MPTARPRIVVTETDELARVLDVARRRWPADAGSPSRLLLRLVEAGGKAIAEEERQLIEERREVIRSNAGSGTGLYQPGDLEQLREDWPA